MSGVEEIEFEFLVEVAGDVLGFLGSFEDDFLAVAEGGDAIVLALGQFPDGEAFLGRDEDEFEGGAGVFQQALDGEALGTTGKLVELDHRRVFLR